MPGKKSHLIILFLMGALSILSLPLPAAIESNRGEEISAALLRAESDSTSEFIISVWKTSEGLPVTDIQDIRETPDGYLWLATSEGLVRFDGVRFETFLNIPSGRRYGSRVGPLELDENGELWSAADQVGVLRRDHEKFTEVFTNSAELQARVVNLCSDGKQHLMWIDANGDLGRFSVREPNTIETIEGNANGASRWVLDFNENMWLVNQRNVSIYKDKKWREVNVPGSANLTVAPRRKGGLWIAREAKLRYVTARGETREIANFPWRGQSRVNCLWEDRQERLWIGTVGQGLFCFSSGQFKQVVPTSSSISCLLEDDEDNIWAGTRGGGLIRVRKRQFFTHDLSSGLANEFVRSLSQDKNGRVWLVSAEGGLGWWWDGVAHTLGLAEKWPKLDSLCVLPARNGDVWISTMRRGLWRWSDGKFIRSNLGVDVMKEPAADLLEDQKGRLWMATDNSGITCLDGEIFKTYSVPEGLPSSHIRCIVQDESGDIWAGDWEGGIIKFNGERWDMIRSPSGHSDAVRSMLFIDKTLWIGTSAGGLLRFKEGKVDRISTDQGLPDVCIQQLLHDGKGSLWGGTPHKLFRASISQLNNVLDGRQRMIDAVSYGRSDGLPDVSFASWCDPRCWRTTEGELWFATANGAIHFQPASLQISKAPQVLLEQILLDGKPTNATSLLHLRPTTGRIEFRFTAPCLTAPERVRFKYQMTGVDADWVDAGTSRTATYASVPAGDHVFHVQASTPDGLWNTPPITIALAVHPFFWQTAWFFAAVAAAVAGGSVWGFRWAAIRRLSARLERLREQRALDQERARIAQDIHDELGANLTSIGLLADMGARHKSDPAAVTRELQQISQTARESVTAMDAIVWALNPRNDSVDHFANYLAQFTRDFFRPTQLRTRLELPANLPAQPLPMEMRHQLFLIVKECFNNVVRHAKATEVYLEIACDDKSLRLTIADDGRGLSDKTVGQGQDGLSNIRQRIERLGGKLAITSKKGKGTKMDFSLPLTKVRMH